MNDSDRDLQLHLSDTDFDLAARSALYAIVNSTKSTEATQHRMMKPLLDYLRSAGSLSPNECLQLADIFEQQLRKPRIGRPDDSGEKERFKYWCVATSYRIANSSRSANQRTTLREAALVVEKQLTTDARPGRRATAEEILNWEKNLTTEVRDHLHGLSEADAHRFYSTSY